MNRIGNLLRSQVAYLGACLALAVSGPSLAQVPAVTLDAPTQSFANEQFCFDITIANSGAPGYGPYVRLVIPSQLQFDSATFTGVGVTASTVGTFPASPGNQLNDPINGNPVTGPAGGTFVILRPPLGSVVTGGPILTIRACCTILDSAVIGTPLTIETTPVYEFGDTPTGANGSIVGAAVTDTVTPILVLLEKLNSAPESERTPGPSFPFTYTLRANIANNKTVSNLVFNDVLPSTIQFVGPVATSGGSNCVVTATPSTSTPGGTLQVTCDSAVGTTGSADVTVSFPVFVVDALDEANCGGITITNPASLDAQFPAGTPISQQAAVNEIDAKHVAVQKGASPTEGRPGDTVSFTLNFQVSDFATASSFTIVDTLPDGMDFVAHSSMTINAGAVAITPSVVVNGDGTVSVTYNVTAAAGALTPGTSGTILFTAVIRQTYLSSGEPVRASDSLQNDVLGSYGLTAGAAGCLDFSSTVVGILETNITKTIVNPQPTYLPGETVTFRLSLEVPSGDTQSIVFEDFFPLPALRVATIDLTGAPTLPTPSIRLSPDDTLGLTPTLISTDAATNKLRIEWPAFSSTTNETISVDVDVDVNDEPRAISLFLTNLLQVTVANTANSTKTALASAGILTGSPSIRVTKGVLSTNNPRASISPASTILPPDGNVSGVDAGDTVTYQITLENLGPAQAYDVRVTDTVPTGLTGCSIVSVTDGTGAALATSGDLFTTGLVLGSNLVGNDGNPAGGGAPFGADTAIITVACTVATPIEAGQVLTNTASATWRSSPTGTPFSPVSDNCTTTVAAATINKVVVASSEASSTDPAALIGETLTYELTITIPEGTSTGSSLTDQLPQRLGLVSLDSITASPALTTSHAGGFAGVLSDATPAPAGCTGSATTVTFPFDTVTNADADNATVESIVVRYTVRVCGATAAVNGATAANNANWISANINVSDSHTTTIGVPVLNVTKMVGPTTANVGDTVTYTVTIEHVAGQSGADAFDVVLTDNLASGLTLVVGSVTAAAPGAVTTGNAAGDTTVRVTLPSLALNTTYAFTYQATIAAAGAVTNTVIAGYDTLPGDGDPTEQVFSDTATATVNGNNNGTIDLRITKTSDRTEVASGDVIVYTISYSNLGTIPASGVVITESIPNFTSFVETQSTAGWSCAGGGVAGSQCTFTVGVVPAGGGGTLLFAVRVAANLPTAGVTINNVASIVDDGGNGGDTDPGNNQGVSPGVNARSTYAEDQLTISVVVDRFGNCAPLCGTMGFTSLSVIGLALMAMKLGRRRWMR